MRKICVVTGSRAEYGLMYWLLREIQEDPELTLQLVVTGMHLSPEFGLTHRQINHDGFTIDDKVEMLLSSDTPVGITKSMGLGLIGFADVFARLQPDVVVILGDRYEMMVVAQSAMIANIPIAHLHGGESTEGVVDEAIRHSITKMAQLHFTAAEKYRQRVIQLGEHPDRVFNVGAVGLDNTRRLALLTRAQLEETISFKLGELCFLVTYHPVTLSYQSVEEQTRQLFEALDHYQHAKVIITKPNSDTNGRIIASLIDEFAKANEGRVITFVSMGQLRYLSALQFVDVVIGNSSSGIYEAPVFHTPTVNIGTRQTGRLMGSSVIHCGESSSAIIQAVDQALSEDFQSKLFNQAPLYGTGDASSRIKTILKEVNLEGILYKSFFEVQI
ncbi:UDP-N-acetylglucosamine 2-epimerase [Paenibacillus albus]|uniref:UDP-N-acetylglucosamine 2-epimerase (Hydrolyzing) n=1 Tax=Paenibacillus albus TaxID=2495582 RepID=A0A3S8ZYI0_9BACL|nr:UDP-N-acetylglucosamine 2-epimerase [Paenibacillus albus]AZN38515.1 UDP-N-acetylglucosamine 2-epimerase (hydrolyzing) [Paenibacillus albus]